MAIKVFKSKRLVGCSKVTEKICTAAHEDHEEEEKPGRE